METVALIAFLVVSFALMGYLTYVLLKPERF